MIQIIINPKDYMNPITKSSVKINLTNNYKINEEINPLAKTIKTYSNQNWGNLQYLLKI